MTTHGTHVTIRQVSGVFVISFTRPDVIDPVYIERVGDEIYRLIKPEEQPRVVMDFGKVKYLSSAALGMLVALDKVIGKQNGKLRIADVSEEVVGVFKLTKLHRLIKIHGTIDEAIKKLGD